MGWSEKMKKGIKGDEILSRDSFWEGVRIEHKGRHWQQEESALEEGTGPTTDQTGRDSEVFARVRSTARQCKHNTMVLSD